MHLPGHGGARVWRRVPAGDQGQGRRRAGAAAGSGLRGREAGGGGLRVRGGRAALAIQVADWFCGDYGVEGNGAGDAAGRREPGRDYQHGGADGDGAVSAARGAVQGGDRGGARAWKSSIRTIICFAWKKPTCARMRARGWPRWRLTGRLLADNAKPGYFAEAQMELAYFGLGDALRGQRHYEEAARRTKRRQGRRTWGRS